MCRDRGEFCETGENPGQITTSFIDCDIVKLNCDNERRDAVSFATMVSCFLTFSKLVGDLHLRYIDSSLEHSVFMVRMLAVMQSLRGREGQVMVRRGACLSRRLERMEENCSR